MSQIIIAFCVFFTSLSVVAQQNILIYDGPGAGNKSVANTMAMVKAIAADKYVIMAVGPETLRQQDWQQNTALLIMPGGADRPYLAELSGLGNENIKNYVMHGGQYLGICAGAYYAADRIEFDKGGKLEVTGARELKFFPGLVEGPTFSGFDYREAQSVAGMRAAQIFWQQDKPFKKNHSLFVFYNGGGHFVDAQKYPQVTILARYAAAAAIVECAVGKGKAILSGVHFEWDPQTLTGTDPALLSIKAELIASNAERLILAKYLLRRLGIVSKGEYLDQRTNPT